MTRCYNTLMILLFTDFGLQGPYIGQMKAVLAQWAPDEPIIDLFTDVPTYNAKAGAHLLAAYCNEFPEGSVFLSVVDPGVGSKRGAVVVQADGRWYVGPDNGLFNVVAKCATQVQWWDISWQPEKLSGSFHGRDLFAPVAAMIARGDDVPGNKRSKKNKNDWSEDLKEIIYIDHFGNVMTGLRASELTKDKSIEIKNYTLGYARTFSEVKSGEAFWYENANGLVEIAVNQDRANETLNLVIGDGFDVI